MKTVVSLIFYVVVLILTACESDNVDVVDKQIRVLPDSRSQGAMLLKSYCSQCHGVPQPTDHVAEHWPNVIERMEIHRIRHAYGKIPESDKQIILEYLQKYAKH